MKNRLIFLLFLVVLTSGCTWGKSAQEATTPVQILDGRSENYDEVLQIEIHRTDNETATLAEGEFRLDQAPVIRWTLNDQVDPAVVTHYNIKVGRDKNSADMWEARKIPASYSQATYGETPAGGVEITIDQELEWGDYYVRVETYGNDEFLGFGDGVMFLK